MSLFRDPLFPFLIHQYDQKGNRQLFDVNLQDGGGSGRGRRPAKFYYIDHERVNVVQSEKQKRYLETHVKPHVGIKDTETCSLIRFLF